MTMVYNTDPAKVDIFAIEGDTIDMRFYVNYEMTLTGKKFYVGVNSIPVNGSPYNLGALKIQVRRKDFLLLKDWLSGVSPSDIVVSGASFHLFDADGFLESGTFDYDVMEFDGVHGFKRIMKGSWDVKKQITI
ncbi:MAG: hypothetical protein MUO72_09390 [Bacteroidales bacterium]|nr:hypothetical protein [Bacteroidales bacterium]